MNCPLFPKIITCFLIFISSVNILCGEENFLLVNGVTNKILVEFGPSINVRISPCSTFKITLSLMGYDAGVLKNVMTPTWDFEDGYDDFLESWKTSLTPESWMKYSCLWYSKKLALELGMENIQSYLISMKYGNEDISGGLGQPGPDPVAWINSSLKISPKEQVAFIQKMLQGKLIISHNTFEMTKAIVFKEELSSGWKLFGKTGWSGSTIAKDGKTREHSWFVGWIEKDQVFYPFAYLIRDKKIDLAARIPRVKQLLLESLNN